MTYDPRFYLLMMIWDYPVQFSNTIEVFVLTSTVVALQGAA